MRRPREIPIYTLCSLMTNTRNDDWFQTFQKGFDAFQSNRDKWQVAVSPFAISSCKMYEIQIISIEFSLLSVPLRIVAAEGSIIVVVIIQINHSTCKKNHSRKELQKSCHTKLLP